MRWKIARHFQIQTRGIPTLAGGAMADAGWALVFHHWGRERKRERENGMEWKVGRDLRVDMWGSPCNPSTFLFIPSHLPTIPPSPFSLFLVPTRGDRRTAFARPPRGQQRWELGLLEFFGIFDAFFVAFRSLFLYCILLLIMILSTGIVGTVGYW